MAEENLETAVPLASSAAWLEVAIATCPSGAAIIDNGRYAYVNAAYSAMVGEADPSALVHQLWPAALPETLPWRGEMALPHRDGRTCLVEVSLSQLPQGPIFCLCHGHRLQLSASRSALSHGKLLRSIAAAIPDRLFIKDLDGRYVFVNRGFAKAVGLKIDEIIGQTDAELFPERAAQFRQEDEQVVTLETNPLIQEESHLRPGGSRLWLRVTKRPLCDPAGEVVGLFGTCEDVTERKAMSAAVRESQTLLRLVMDAIPQAIMWKDRDSVFQGCNRVFAQRVGLASPEDVVGLTDYDLPRPRELAEFYRRDDQRLMELDQAELGLIEAQTLPNGELSWIEINKIPLHNAEGKVVGLLCAFADVTERQQQGARLKQSEGRFRRLAQREELFNRVSQRIRQSLDLTDILQTTVQELRQLFETDRLLVYQFGDSWQGQVTVEALQPPWPSVLGAMEADSCFPETFAALYQQGRVRAIDDVANGDLDECHTQYLLGLQVRSNLIVPILVQDQLWGLLLAHQCSHVRRWKQDEVDLLEAIAAQVGVAIRQAQLYHQATANALRSQRQADELEQTLKKLRQAQAQMVQQEKMSSLGQLVAGVAHEINNPMSFIYGNLMPARTYIEGMLKLVTLYQRHYREPDAEVQRQLEAMDWEFVRDDLPKLLDSMQLGAERIQSIISSLRIFSRTDEAEIKSVDIHQGIDSTLMILRSRLRWTEGQVQVVKDYGQLPRVDCYAGQLNQVVMNLLSNALDALEQAPCDQPTIRIVTRLLRWPRRAGLRPSPQVQITIADNGPGISQPMQERIFDPFFTTKPVGKGTGMGLPICYQIVTEKHGGTLECQSQPGEGSQFIITIPLRQFSRESHRR